MTRHFTIVDPDGRNVRHVTMGEYLDALDRGEKPRLELYESDVKTRGNVTGWSLIDQPNGGMR